MLSWLSHIRHALYKLKSQRWKLWIPSLKRCTSYKLSVLYLTARWQLSSVCMHLLSNIWTIHEYNYFIQLVFADQHARTIHYPFCRGKLTVFTVLCEKYEPSINRDPVYKEYLDKIGQNYFGVPAPVESGGFLGLSYVIPWPMISYHLLSWQSILQYIHFAGGIMRSLFSDLTGDSEEEDFYQLASSSEAPSSATERQYASSDVDWLCKPLFQLV